MKPDWDKLASEYDGSDVLVADVDCTADGKPLCDKHGITGFPTIKTFASRTADGRDYSGARTLKELRKAAARLAPWKPSLGFKVGFGLVSAFAVWVAGSFLRLWA